MLWGCAVTEDVDVLFTEATGVRGVDTGVPEPGVRWGLSASSMGAHEPTPRFDGVRARVR